MYIKQSLLLVLIGTSVGGPLPIRVQAEPVVQAIHAVAGEDGKALTPTQQPVLQPTSSRQVVTDQPLNPQPTYKRKQKRSTPDFFKQQQAKELLRASSQLTLGIGLTAGMYYLMGTSEPLNLSMLAAPLIGAMLTKPLSNLFNKLCLLFTPGLAKPELQKAIHFKNVYESRKSSLSTSMRIFLETTIYNYLHAIEYFDHVEKHHERAIEEVLQFPIRPQEVKPNIIPPLKDFLKNYPEKVRIALGNFVAQIIQDSQFKQLEKKAVPLLFVGPPGTGKTYLASQLGQLLGLSVQLIDISKYKAINGHHFWSNDSERGILADVLLGNQAQEENFANKILILDEIDKVLAKDKKGSFIHKSGPEVMAFLHTLLETQETTAKLRHYNNAAYDISHVKIILIGNRTFTEVLGPEEAMALESRVSLVRFDDFKETQKLNIAQAYVVKRCQQQGIDYNCVDQAMIKSIVQADTQAGYQGVRILLQVMDEYLRILAQSTLIGDIASVPPIVFDVQEAYAKK